MRTLVPVLFLAGFAAVAALRFDLVPIPGLAPEPSFDRGTWVLPRQSGSTGVAEVERPVELPPQIITGSRRSDFTGRVTRVVDGDTFRISGQGASIRVWGLDAPETHERRGAAATAMLTRLVSGKTLQCRQRDIDRYGRIVGQCWLPDGRDITAAMIDSGTATEYCHFSGNHYGTC